MNKDQIAGKWQQLKGEARQQWGKLTDDQLDQVEGDRMKLAGLVREQYGIAKEEAEKQVDDFYARQERADKSAA